MDRKFKRGDRIYPNLQALDESMPHGHTWGMVRKGMGWCSKEERVAEPYYVNAAGWDSSKAYQDGAYLLGAEPERGGTCYAREWVEKHFRSEAEHVEHLLTLASSPFESVRAINARNALMDIGDRLTVEVSACRGDAFESAFEKLLQDWKRHQYRPSLYGSDKARLLADIYDFAQRARGADVVAYRGSEAP